MNNPNKFYKTLVFYLIVCNFSQAQNLNHQMINCQGNSSSNTSIVNVLFTVGQQSVIGTSINGFTVQQGFQQSNWSKIMQQNTIYGNTTVYPNPIKDVVNFSFSNSPGNDISVVVFDLLGRIVHSEIVKNNDNIIFINLNNLSAAEYFVKLTSDNFIYSTKLIKQ